MDYVKKVFESIIPIIKYFVLSYLVVIIFYLVFYLFGYKDQELYIMNYAIYISLVFNIIYILVLNKKYKVRYDSVRYGFPLSILGISISSFCNTLFFLVSRNDSVYISKIVLIISSVIIGPIIEEILFRYILIRNLRCFNGRVLSVIISSVIFSLFHNGLVGVFYSLVLGLVLGSIYIRKMNIANSIIVHSFANLTSLYICSYNSYILLLSFILLIISVKILKRKYFVGH